MFTTPPGTSEVASALSELDRREGALSDASDRRVPADDHRCQPADEPAQRRLVRCTIPTTGRLGIVKLKYGAATGFEVPRTCAYLSAHPAYQTHRSTALSTSCGPS